MSDPVEAALQIVNRRDYLFSKAPACVRCGDRQVQCTDWLVVPSEWKCRICKHRFTFEPAYK